jgi:D-alanine transfer protein
MSGNPDPVSAPALSHLGPALISVALTVVCLVSATAVAKRWSRAHLDALGPINLPQKNLGVLLQREIARAPTIIPVYGSSELARASEFRADEFFAKRPHGFAVAPVGERGTTLLNTLQQIGAVGKAFAGRKVIVLVSPRDFLRVNEQSEARRKEYAGNYSRLQAQSVIFGADFDLAFKRRVAARLLRFPEVLEDDPVLRFALNRLVNGGLVQRAGYYLAAPLGRLQMEVSGWADAVSVLELLARRPSLSQAVPAVPQPIDWGNLADSAMRIYRPRAGHNPAGFEDAYWNEFDRHYLRLRGRGTDSNVGAALERSPRWTDLGLIVEGLKKMGAKPLVLTLPLPSQFYFSYLGLSPSVWQIYYKKLRSIVGAAGGRITTFEANDLDPFLLRDEVHPSPEGWILLDRAIDEFAHDTPH